MGSCLTKEDDESVEVIKFMELGNEDEAEEPHRSRKQRSQTNTFFLVLIASFLLTLTVLIFYCYSISNINVIIHGYDNCGNVCGEDNRIHLSGPFSCAGKDMTNKPFLASGKCVESCEAIGYNTFLYRCIRMGAGIENDHFLFQFTAHLFEGLSSLIYIVLITFFLIGSVLLLLRYFVGIFIWTLLIGGSFLAILLSTCLWISYTGSKFDNPVLLAVAIVVSLFTIIVVMIIIVLRKRIKLIIQLFKEASKAIGAVPHILFQPLLTFVAFAITYPIFWCSALICFTAGSLTETEMGHIVESNVVVVITRYLLSIALYWLTFFYLGCQNMVIGGTIAQWYFARNKSRLDSTMWRSTVNLVKYHLGTVAFGSLILLIMTIIKKIFDVIYKKCRHAACCCCCLCALLRCLFKAFERFVNYFTTISYIVTAMHGVPFCEGGQYAVKLFVRNGSAVLKLNSIGSFILFLIKWLIITLTILMSALIFESAETENAYVPIALSAVITYVLTTAFLSVYKTAIDTIFICFCEDSELNDGVTKPYFMSKDLMQFVDHSNKVLNYIDSNVHASGEEQVGRAPNPNEFSVSS